MGKQRPEATSASPQDLKMAHHSSWWPSALRSLLKGLKMSPWTLLGCFLSTQARNVEGVPACAPPGLAVLRPILPRVLCLFSRTIKVEVYDWDRDGR